MSINQKRYRGYSFISHDSNSTSVTRQKVFFNRFITPVAAFTSIMCNRNDQFYDDLGVADLIVNGWAIEGVLPFEFALFQLRAPRQDWFEEPDLLDEPCCIVINHASYVVPTVDVLPRYRSGEISDKIYNADVSEILPTVISIFSISKKCPKYIMQAKALRTVAEFMINIKMDTEQVLTNIQKLRNRRTQKWQWAYDAGRKIH